MGSLTNVETLAIFRRAQLTNVGKMTVQGKRNKEKWTWHGFWATFYAFEGAVE